MFNINPASAGALFAVLDIVRSSMDLPARAGYDVRDVTSEEIIAYDEEIRLWSFQDVLCLAGRAGDDARFDELLMTEVGSFVNHQLGM